MAGLLVLAAGCNTSLAGRRVDLEANDPSDRIRAIVATVEEGRTDPCSAVAALVDRLDDEDQAVRVYAIAGLARLTGQRLGFRAHDPAPRRRAAVERWREYLGGSATAQPGPAS